MHKIELHLNESTVNNYAGRQLDCFQRYKVKGMSISIAQIKRADTTEETPTPYPSEQYIP